MSSRRDFLGALAGSALAPFFPARSNKLDRIGIQLYTVRRELGRDPEGTLARLAEIGFREVEFVGYPAGTPQAVRAMLDRHGLSAPSSQVALQALLADAERTLEQAAIVGQRYIVVASVPENERRTLDAWKRTVAALNRAGETARKHQIQFCYHNHDVEFTPLEGAVPYDVLLSATDPHLVQLELDLYWMTKGGKDPLDYVTRWPGRFPLVHVKDMDATPRKFFTEVGKGTIDFRRIFRRAQLAGMRHYFYEQDETPGDVFASARASYRYLRSLTF
ncbi:MAG TPA: sugar phosphate isomerase/epimerase [Gemmatimonadales bacterium]|jgi:sugar phosphate isomerase/epimerase